MYKFIIKTIKATIINVIVALLSTCVFFICIYLLFGQEIDDTISLINKISIDIDNKKENEIIINEENKIINYPEYGTKYADIEIPKIDVNLPVYFGDTLEVLKKNIIDRKKLIYNIF